MGELVPRLADPSDWPRLRAELESRLVTRLQLVRQDDQARPYAIEADSELRGRQIVGIDWEQLDPVGAGIESLIERLDTQGETRPSVPRPTRHAIGKKGRRHR
jgi:hypothetical protein